MWVTAEGVMEVSEAPREVRMSAEPEAEVEALLPCLPVRGTLALCMGEREGGGGCGGVQIRRPQPDARMAEVVETLKVLWPSPPVPTMSTWVAG